MACTYNYKGHTFGSEEELDDFILEKLPFEPLLGDLVFEYTAAQTHVADQLSSIAKANKGLNIDSLKKTIVEDGQESIDDYPHVGVTDFLSKYISIETEKQLFPEFIPDKYWEKRFKAWKSDDPNRFTVDEIQEFGFDPDNLPIITNQDQMNQMRQQMEHRWQVQNLIGKVEHHIMKICFSKTKQKYNFSFDDATLMRLIKDQLSDEEAEIVDDTKIINQINIARQLNSNLINKLGDNLNYYTEFSIQQDVNLLQNGERLKLIGVVDLLIVDKTGKVHILDYKTSIHSYNEYSDAKRLSYTYQLATYQRMFEKSGLNMYDGRLMILPIHITNFRKDEDEHKFDGFAANYGIIDISPSSRMLDRIDEFMPTPFRLSVSTESAIQQTTNIMREWIPEYSQIGQVTRDDVLDELKKNNYLIPDDNGNFTYNRIDDQPIVCKDEAEFVDKVTKYKQTIIGKKLKLTSRVKQNIKDAIKNGIEATEFVSPKYTEKDSSLTYLRDMLAPYCNGAWEVVDNETFESFGIITLKTKEGLNPKRVHFVKISTQNLTYDTRNRFRKNKESDPLKGRTGLTRKYESDVQQQSKQNSLMLTCNTGNIELLEAMVLLNQSKGIEGFMVDGIDVINPYTAKGITAYNEQLVYCWNELNKFYKVENDKIGSGEIKFTKFYDKAQATLDHIIQLGEEHKWKDHYTQLQGLRTCASILDDKINADSEQKIAALEELRKHIKTITQKEGQNTVGVTDKVYFNLSELNQDIVRLDNEIQFAINQLRGINFKQQLQENAKYLESINIFVKGATGLYADNPGNVNNDTLNLITKLVTSAYQNVRDAMQKKKLTISKLVDDLKKEKNFGKMYERTFGNQTTSLYGNMTKVTADGNLVFINPDTLQGQAEKKFLQYVLLEINRNRFNKTDEQLLEMQERGDIEYYQVPLCQGNDDSTGDLMSLAKAKFQQINPKKAFDKARRKLEGIFNADEDLQSQRSREILFTMTNQFDSGENSSIRIDYINRLGIENFERNLEALLYKHEFAYTLKDNIDGVFPMIKSAMTHIAMQAAIQNTKFTSDIEYFQDYIKNKILNQLIIDPKFKELYQYLGLLRSAASKFTLAFSPVQFGYQMLQQLWVDVSLMIRKPDGRESFTFKHFKNAWNILLKDMTHYSDKPTLCSAFNELYALNDMDMNVYSERISTTRRGIWNFWGMAMKCNTRPDFYSRLSIFLCQLQADGSLDAHHVDENGELIYDWKKDKRFEAFANGWTQDPRYNQQRSLYYAVAKQFVFEQTLNKDGSKFQVNMEHPMALPRAYTNQEAESMKALADNIYGYYSHEKKSLIQSTLLGAMWLQFKTYWSSKKNQHLQPGGIRVRGQWKQVEENGQKYYYQVDENGRILYEEPPTINPTIAPVMRWEGQWQEGIFVTLSELLKTSYNEKSLKAGWDYIWNNEDPNLRLAYRSNLNQLWYDFMMFMIGGVILAALLGDWLEKLEKDNKKNEDPLVGLGISAANIAVMCVKNSFFDFNVVQSIGSPIYQWTPFSFDWGVRTIKNITKVAMGDEDIVDGLIKMTSGTRQFKPFFDSIKPKQFRTKREGGTFGE